MFIDFQNLDFEKLKHSFYSDEYYAKVLDFLDLYLHNESFTSHTSGSTGEPKAILIENYKAEASAKISNEYFKVNSEFHFLLCLDIKFIGSKLLLIRAAIQKAKVTVIKPRLEFYSELEFNQFDFISLTPIHIDYILEHQPSFFNQIKICLIGSSSVTYHLESKIKESKFKTRFYESYGMTETLSHIAIRNISAHETSFEVLKEFEVSSSADNYLSIYHPIILPEKITTSDIVEFIDHSHFVFKGRKDNIINSSGLKINPELLENEWSLFLPFEFILAGSPENTLGQQLIMIVRNYEISTSYIFELLSKNNISTRLQPKLIYHCSNWSETLSLKPIRAEIFKNKELAN